MSIQSIIDTITKLEDDLEKNIDRYNRIYETIRQRGHAIQALLEGNQVQAEIGQQLQIILTSIENSKQIVQIETTELSQYKQKLRN
ncbi:hypothetical protein NOL38_05085 [Streptococcus suis]|uniref:hypothetical protein n=1 Tax=Streptococcus suis TaxID=1307 RepID=UPI002003BBC6|nr:hypothetical protein [Streptococcus suis]MCK4004340.1 hypothetical protein [Streptococcus suis]MDG4505636.1 hypothetical protein [Streptococcus suis]HEM2825124.1 hypothetical protein [Streptococcus suis]HEM4403555.1 hypothetical protein [Streptococcus suis]